MSDTRTELFRYYPPKGTALPGDVGDVKFKSDDLDLGATVCYFTSGSLMSADFVTAFDRIKDENPIYEITEITIRANESLLMSPEAINNIDKFPLPEELTLVNIDDIDGAEVDNCINFIAKLPNSVSKLTLDLKLSDPTLSLENIKRILFSIPNNITSLSINFDKFPKDEEKVIQENVIKEIISSIPDHISDIAIPNIFGVFKDNDEENNKLAEIFGSFHNNVKKIEAVDAPNYEPDDPQQKAIPDSRLKKVLLHLPFSVQEIKVQGKPSELDVTAIAFNSPKKVKMQSFRDKNYFPNYKNIANTPTAAVPNSNDELFDQAKRILNDYSKHDSAFPSVALFFSGRWNLNHVNAVNNALKKCNTFEELYSAIKNDIKLVNPIGSLARRIRYIESLPGFEERIPAKRNQNTLIKK